jgi:hypothetical protein
MDDSWANWLGREIRDRYQISLDVRRPAVRYIAIARRVDIRPSVVISDSPSELIASLATVAELP